MCCDLSLSLNDNILPRFYIDCEVLLWLLAPSCIILRFATLHVCDFWFALVLGISGQQKKMADPKSALHLGSPLPTTLAEGYLSCNCF